MTPRHRSDAAGSAKIELMIGWVLVGRGGLSGRGHRRGGGRRFALPPVSFAHPPTRCVGGAGCGFKIERRRWQALPSERVPGSCGCCRWWGGLGLGVVGCRGRALSSVGPRRQSGTCREVKRREFPLVARCLSVVANQGGVLFGDPLCHAFFRGSPSEDAAGAGVEEVFDVAEIVEGVAGEVGALGEVLA